MTSWLSKVFEGQRRRFVVDLPVDYKNVFWLFRTEAEVTIFITLKIGILIGVRFNCGALNARWRFILDMQT